ncbi:protein phosphatase 1 regulatory subunit 3A isoform X4 [Megalobrama amblycephala]|uniref:protein phosphatase 1 regulatory subunit 3A isoform X4 n=1 Tax=Megalobrama amblycephala TaxID=75352 RepID=UPI0020142B27|nr:protein phosphatase 1 regulatory subunit 3A isoform X4 [Megalobrama amblycephala]
MAQGNNSNFLTIPSQEGLFKTVRVERSEDNSNDEEEEETEEDVHLIPRSSPVPRKRGSSIADETAEYMRIRLGLPNRKVSFVDSTGAELVDVRMFVPFDSDDEDDSRWEEEEARYRKTYREPTYRVWPEFQALAGTELVLAVHTNKLEVESVTSVPDEPLSFEVIIRVLNISFHKSVYVRSTMDGWINHFDYPAEYVQGSNDGETDKFSVKLSFASPYLFNGARIDFVVRYETSDGEFWANNSGRNYSVTLLQSYEDDETAQATIEEKNDLRGILKPPRADIGYDDSDDRGDDLGSTECEVAEDQASFAQPPIVQPEIDIETAKDLSSSPESTRTSSKAGCPLSTSDTPFGEPLPLESMSSSNLPQTEESGIQPLILPFPQSQSTQQPSETQDKVHNVVPSIFLSLPEVLIHPYDGPETTKDEFEDSNKPTHAQKDDFQLEILAQVPFEFGQPSLAGCPDTTHIQEEGMKDVKEKEDIEENDCTSEDMLEKPSQNIGEDKTGKNFHILEEAKQPPPSNEVNNTTEDMEKLSLSKNIQHTLEEGIQEQKVELVSSVQLETTKAVEVESTKLDDEETNVLVASCLSHSHLIPTRQDRETQSLLIHSTSDKPATIQHQQEEGLVLDPILHEDPKLDNQIISMCTPEHQTSKQEKLKLVSVSETSPTAFDLQPSTVHSSAEDDLTSEGDEPSTAPYQTSKDSETQHTLPRDGTELSQISKDQTEVTLDTCLMVSMIFFSAAICLAVVIREPSALLYVGLFLLSLWF